MLPAALALLVMYPPSLGIPLWKSCLSGSAMACAVLVQPPDEVVPAHHVTAAIRIGGQSGYGHGCPISANEAITAKHVMWDDEYHEMRPAAWSDSEGHEGRLTPEYSDKARDLAGVSSVESFHNWLPLATEAPKVGDEVWLIGYDFSKRGMPSRIVKAKVTGFSSGMLITSNSPGPGASGSCITNAAGEVVGIVQGIIDAGDTKHYIGVAVYPPWFPVPEQWREEAR